MSEKTFSLCTKKTGKLVCGPADSPTDPNHHLSVNVTLAVKNVNQYEWLVGKLLYLSITLPDIANIVVLSFSPYVLPWQVEGRWRRKGIDELTPACQ